MRDRRPGSYQSAAWPLRALMDAHALARRLLDGPCADRDDHHAAQLLVPLRVALATLGEHGAATDTAAMLVDRLARTRHGYHASIAAVAAQRCLYQPPVARLCGP